MKIYLRTCLLIITPIFFAGSPLSSQDKPDKRLENKWISFDRLSLQSDGRKWMTVAVQLTPKDHPNKDAALNEKFIDDIQVDLYLCFKNKTKEKKIFKDTGRKPQLKETLDYYHAYVEIPTMEVDFRTKTIQFILPIEIAKRDGWDRTQKPDGYVIEIKMGETIMPLKESIAFAVDGKNYRDDEILQNFKREAIANSSETEGLLMPAHLVDASFLNDAPVLKFPKQSY